VAEPAAISIRRVRKGEDLGEKIGVRRRWLVADTSKAPEGWRVAQEIVER
jgi:hypothetical protein